MQNLGLLPAYGAGPQGIDKLKQDIERLKAFTGMEPETKPKRKEKHKGDDNESED